MTELLLIPGLVGLAVFAALLFRAVVKEEGRLFYLWERFHWWRRYGRRIKVPECGESVCSGEYPKESRRNHGRCVECGAVTCRRSGWVDEDGRRRVSHICDEHFWERKWGTTQWQRRKDRRLNDLTKLTVPPVTDHLVSNTMPDQFAGLTRDAIRAFRDSDESEVLVLKVSASAINASLRSTGLDDEMYAEIRNGETILRRVDR